MRPEEQLRRLRNDSRWALAPLDPRPKFRAGRRIRASFWVTASATVAAIVAIALIVPTVATSQSVPRAGARVYAPSILVKGGSYFAHGKHESAKVTLCLRSSRCVERDADDGYYPPVAQITVPASMRYELLHLTVTVRDGDAAPVVSSISCRLRLTQQGQVAWFHLTATGQLSHDARAPHH